MATGTDSPQQAAAPTTERTWLFVGDFLFYLRLLARQFANLAKSRSLGHKSMVIIPEFGMAWDQLAEGKCEVVVLDCAESSETQLDFIRELRIRYPGVRRILVSANLSRQMESELMQAGAHLCFAKPRNAEEAASMFCLVDALAGSHGFMPSGSFKGLAPARFIQFLCARNESGSIAMETKEGEGTLVLQDGQIVDATLGELRGDAAAARILSLDSTNRCRFKHMQTSQYHTVQLNTHQLWIDSTKVREADAAAPPTPVRTPPAKSIRETMDSLNALDNLAFDIHIEAGANSKPGGGAMAKISQQIHPEANPSNTPVRKPPVKQNSTDDKLHPGMAVEEVITGDGRSVMFSRNSADPNLRAEFLGFLRAKSVDVAKRTRGGGVLSIRSEEGNSTFIVEFAGLRSIFRLIKPEGPVPPPIVTPPVPSPQENHVDRQLREFSAKAPAFLCGFFDARTGKAWNFERGASVQEESAATGLAFAISACLNALDLHRLPAERMVWELESSRIHLRQSRRNGFVLAVSELFAPQKEILSALDLLAADLLEDSRG